MTMRCNCKEKSFSWKIEADFSADPIWCAICGANLDLEEIPLSSILKEELTFWVLDYGSWLDMESDSLVENAEIIEREYNTKGLQLTEKVKNELDKIFSIKFVPSNIVELYKNK